MDGSALAAATRRAVRVVRVLGAVGLLALLAACASHSYGPRGWSGRQYRAPGPSGDPWGPYVTEAAARFRIPERWIREVMRQESGGNEYLGGEPITSSAGAMGLMQVMPGTYDILRGQYGLGDDPYDPHDNIMAGAAYIREMYDRYGSPGFLAAYNAGPGRVDAYLGSGEPLPDETVNYVASVAPHLSAGPAMSGPLAAYADTGGGYAVASAAPPVLANGACNADAAYNPSRPCASYAVPAAPTPVVAPVAAPVMLAAHHVACDPNAAYDPSQACQPAPIAVAQAAVTSAAGPLPVCDADAAYDPQLPCQPAPVQAIRTASLVTAEAEPPPLVLSLPRRATPPSGDWGIQVGAFRSPDRARQEAGDARARLPDLLRGASVRSEPTTPFGSTVLYRARLVGLSAGSAAAACSRLMGSGTSCMTVAPGPI